VQVLKVLYDMDICDEEVILAWNKRTAIAEAVGVTEKHAEAARYAASPLIKWLEEADEDSDEE
jgi:50S ribosomal subunit-associated GTPase HflX